MPKRIDFSTALSIAKASSCKPTCCKSNAAHNIEANGFAQSFPLN